MLYENSLSIAAFSFFLVSIVGHALSGRAVLNHSNLEHGRPTVSLVTYLGSGHFLGSLFENWQSEFLQMALFVWLTVYLKQKGSSESKDPYEAEETDEDPREKVNDPDVPRPVRRGGVALKLYEHSLSLALAFLFVASWSLHAITGWREHVREAVAHGQAAPSMGAYLGAPDFWFETFQNWQSEFLSVFVLVVLSIFLRERGSAQSKPVAAPHAETE